MNGHIIGMLAETFIHTGTGQSANAIDLPVAREAATQYPFIAGSSLKGALKDNAEQQKENDNQKDIKLDSIFGKQEGAGNLLVSDARLLLLPVRSLNDTYKWVTCPHVLERYKRDLNRASNSSNIDFPLAVNAVSGETINEGNRNKLYLEERTFNVTTSELDQQLIEQLKQLIAHEEVRTRLSNQLVILSDKDFAWFTSNGLAIQARNQLDDNKISKNLWYEESLPPDTLMYTLWAERWHKKGTIQSVKDLYPNSSYLQVGGNETVGQGWFALQWREV